MNMAEPVDATPADLEREMMQLGERARQAAALLATAATDQKQSALRAMAARIRAMQTRLLVANKNDVERAQATGKPGSFIDRLTLTPDRIDAMAKGLEDVAILPDPVGAVMANSPSTRQPKRPRFGLSTLWLKQLKISIMSGMGDSLLSE